MSDRAHYPARFTDPDPSSFAAFLFTGAEILEADPAPEIWMAPFRDTSSLGREAAAWARRVNPLLDAFDQEYRDAAAQTLVADGWSPDELASPRFHRIIDQLVAGQRAKDCLGAKAAGDVPPYASQFTRNARLIAGVVIETDGPSDNARYEAAARRLNRGGSRRSGMLFSRDHIRRARERYLLELARVVNMRIAPSTDVDVPLFLEAELANLLGLVVGLEEVWTAAAERREFPWLKGSALAEAIHRKHSLPECLHRALDIVSRRPHPAAA